MKLGYVMLIAGCLSMLGGIAAIIMAIVGGVWITIWRGLILFFASPWLIRAGARRIAKARLQQLSRVIPPEELDVFKAQLDEKLEKLEEGLDLAHNPLRGSGLAFDDEEDEEKRAEKKHRLEQEKGDEARRWIDRKR